MARQIIKNDVPELWKQRARAGLCPVCGKSKAEFGKGMVVYCSKKCRDVYASHYEIWGNLRDKIFKRDKETCKKCGMNNEKADNEWQKSRENMFKEFFEKEAREFEVFRDKELEELSKKYEEEYKDILNDIRFFKDRKWTLEKQFGKDYPDLFAYSHRIPTFNVDHIIAVVNGGDMWDEENLQTLCVDCHKKKTKEDMMERKRNKIKTRKLNESSHN